MRAEHTVRNAARRAGDRAQVASVSHPTLARHWVIGARQSRAVEIVSGNPARVPDDARGRGRS